MLASGKEQFDENFLFTKELKFF